MRRWIGAVFILWYCASSTSVARGADLSAGAMRVLRDNCYACHNAEKHKGGLVLATRADALKGGDSGPALVAGKSSASPLVAALAADADPHMPPKKQLKPEEVETLRAWVDAGAAWDENALAVPPTPSIHPVTLRPLPPTYQPAMAMALSPDQRRLAVGRGGRVLVFDVSKKERPLVWAWQVDGRELVYSLAWSPDGQRLAAGGYRSVRLFKVDGSEPDFTLRADFAGRVTSIAFGGNDTLYAADGEAAYPGVVHAFHLPDGEAAGEWTAHADAVLSMRVSKDGSRLITAGCDKLVRVWSLHDRKEIAKFEGHTAQVTAVALSADGNQLATAGADHEIKIWDLKTREQTASLLTNPQGVTSLAWVDDKVLLSTAEDGVARYSSTADRERPQRTFAGATDVLYCAAIANNAVYAACHDGRVYVWSADGAKLLGTLQADERGPTTEPSSTASLASTKSDTISFVSDVLPVMSRAGCNAGACHAKPHGQSGFKLSVFAFDPKSDYRAITKDVFGRRVFPAAPEESLLLLKPTMAVEHGGGKRLEQGSDAYKLLAKWIEQGMPYQRPGEPALAAVEVYPKQRRYAKGATQQLLVTAKYADGSERDVTKLADFASNEKELAQVNEDGVVRVGQTSGEGAVVARFMGLVDVSRVTIPSDVVLPPQRYADLPVNNFIDPLVHEKLRSLGILPSPPCTDGEFLRRAYLDVVGALPPVREAEEFLDSRDPAKRDKLIDRLLADPRYADIWANKWGDLLRPNPFRAGVKSVYTLDEWLRQSFRANKPYDQFAREILLAEGSTHRDGPVVIYRDRREPQDFTTLFSQVFLGVRLECAKCHHHPNERWSQDDFYHLAAFFGPLKRKGQGISAPISGEAEFVWFAPGSGQVKQPVTGEVMKPKAPDAQAVASEDQDPRRALADWLTRPDNPFFARAVANRVWAELMGRGVVHPVDDFRVSNPATNDPLLDALAKDFVDHHYDLKHLIGTILHSRAYQRSSLPNETNLRDTKYFSRWYRRRPPAEVLMDATADVIGVPDALPGVAPGSRAVLAWNNRLDSEFLDAFGRPNASADPPCERDREGSIVQALHLMNSTKLASRIADPTARAAALARSPLTPRGIATQLYLAALARRPSEEELAIAARTFGADGATRQTATEDLLWALVNSAEFVLNH